MSNSVKILTEQVEKINELLKDKDFNYRSRNDFVVKAVENEIRLATLKHVLRADGKIYFDMLYNAKLIEVVEGTSSFRHDKSLSTKTLVKNGVRI